MYNIHYPNVYILVSIETFYVDRWYSLVTKINFHIIYRFSWFKENILVEGPHMHYCPVSVFDSASVPSHVLVLSITKIKEGFCEN